MYRPNVAGCRGPTVPRINLTQLTDNVVRGIELVGHQDLMYVPSKSIPNQQCFCPKAIRPSCLFFLHCGSEL